MTTIRLLDARRGLNIKCRELFRDEKIAEAIYRYLCNGIEECEDAEPKRKTGKWMDKGWNGDWQYQTDGRGRSWHEWQCSECNHITKGAKWHFCPNCGANMRGVQE